MWRPNREVHMSVIYTSQSNALRSNNRPSAVSLQEKPMAPVSFSESSCSRTTIAVIVTLGMALTVGGALAFEYIGGYIPCALCLLQRNPYYYGIPVGIAAILTAKFQAPAWITRSLLAVIGIMMLAGAGMGGFHSG